jgi:hypothetical protein
MIRLLHGGVAVGVGAADALLTSKVSRRGPGGISFAVYLEALSVAAGLWGGRVGVDADVRDSLLLAGLTLGGARLTNAAAKGQLMAGPKAWGGDPFYGTSTGGDYGQGGMFDNAGGAPSLPAPRAVRVLPGRAAVGGGYSIYPATQEAPGVAG